MRQPRSERYASSHLGFRRRLLTAFVEPEHLRRGQRAGARKRGSIQRGVCFLFPWVRGPVLNTTHAQIPLDPTNYPVWAATAYLPPNTAFRYSFIRKESNGTVSHFAFEHVCTCNRVLTQCMGHHGQVISDSGPARANTTPASGILSIVTSWH